MTTLANGFSPDPDRPGWSRCAISGGELRAETEWLGELDELGLLDPERWRAERLGGVAVQRERDRWVRCIPGKQSALFAKYRRGARRGEWVEELLHGRKPLSAAGREERAKQALERAGLATVHIVLAGEITSRLRVERESFLVTRELVDFEPIRRVQWDELAPGIRELLRGFGQRRVPAPELSCEHSTS